MTSDKQIVAVVGATGGQGGSVVDALLETGKYRLRAIVRDPGSDKAKQLAAKGVEVAQGDLDDRASLIEAFKGSYAIFGVTNFFEPFMKYGPTEAERRELIQAKNLAEAAAATSDLYHYIWSTLPSPAALSQNEYPTPHFDAKAFADEYILQNLPDLAAKTTFLWVTYYASNLTFPVLTPNLLQTSGQYAWIQPVESTTPITTIGDHRKNVGIFVEAIFRQPELTRGGKYVLAEVETLTNQEYLERWGKVTGKSTVYVPSTLEAYNKLFPDWGLEIGLMLKFFEKLRGNSWTKPGVTPLLKDDLDIDVSRLAGLDAAFAQIKWD